VLDINQHVFTKTPEIRIDLWSSVYQYRPPCFYLGCSQAAAAQVRLPAMPDRTWVSACGEHLYAAVNRALLITYSL